MTKKNDIVAVKRTSRIYQQIFDVEHVVVSASERGSAWIDFTFRLEDGSLVEVTAHLSDKLSAYGAERFRAAALAFNKTLGLRDELLVKLFDDR